MLIHLDKEPLIPVFQFLKQAALNQKHLTKIAERLKYNMKSLAKSGKLFSFAVLHADTTEDTENHSVGCQPVPYLFAHLYGVQACYLFFFQTK